MTKPTEETWRAEISDFRPVYRIYRTSDDHPDIADMETYDVGKEAEARARLAASAPELYRALEFIEREWMGDSTRREDPRFAMVRAALAKARGE